jgi:hypothetical protein
MVCPFVCIGSPHPLPTSECVSPTLILGGHTRLQWRGGGGNSDDRPGDSGTLYTLWCMVDVCPIGTGIVHISEYTRKLHSLVFRPSPNRARLQWQEKRSRWKGRKSNTRIASDFTYIILSWRRWGTMTSCGEGSCNSPLICRWEKSRCLYNSLSLPWTKTLNPKCRLFLKLDQRWNSRTNSWVEVSGHNLESS